MEKLKEYLHLLLNESNREIKKAETEKEYEYACGFNTAIVKVMNYLTTIKYND